MMAMVLESCLHVARQYTPKSTHSEKFGIIFHHLKLVVMSAVSHSQPCLLGFVSRVIERHTHTQRPEQNARTCPPLNRNKQGLVRFALSKTASHQFLSTL
ncbi:hypothetical protein Dimus_021068 [Dionaea muscipula]